MAFLWTCTLSKLLTLVGGLTIRNTAKKEISVSCSKEAGTEGNAEKTNHVDNSPPEWCQNCNICVKIG